MQYANYILTKLLHKYENSKAFSDGSSTRRIALLPLADPLLAGKLENVDEKAVCLSVIRDLAQQGIIGYSWKKFEQGNLLDKLWLCYGDAAALAKAYELAKLSPKRQLLQELDKLLTAAEEKPDLLPWIKEFYQAMQAQIRLKHNLPSILAGDIGNAADIIKALTELSETQGEEILERVFSLRCYGNSKYFEKNVKNRLYSIIKQYLLGDWAEAITKDAAFAQVGIVKWPEIMEFCGAAEAVLSDGTSINYQAEKFGAYINSKLAKCVNYWRLNNIKKIIFIENKANYTWYLETLKTAEELVIYHGGQYSPVRGRFFRAITKEADQSIEVYHWSDIDLGGFLIFNRLQKILPQLKPYKMDETAFMDMHKYGVSMDEGYRRKLAKLLADDKYKIFHGVISQMLATNKKIEQECFLF